MTMIIEAVKSRKMKKKRIRSRLSGGSSCVTILVGLWGHSLSYKGKIFPKHLLFCFTGTWHLTCRPGPLHKDFL